MRLFLFSDPPISKLWTGELYHWVMYEYHYLLTMVGMTHKVGTTNNVVVLTNKVAATQPGPIQEGVLFFRHSIMGVAPS